MFPHKRINTITKYLSFVTYPAVPNNFVPVEVGYFVLASYLATLKISMSYLEVGPEKMALKFKGWRNQRLVVRLDVLDNEEPFMVGGKEHNLRVQLHVGHDGVEAFPEDPYVMPVLPMGRAGRRSPNEVIRTKVLLQKLVGVCRDYFILRVQMK